MTGTRQTNPALDLHDLPNIDVVLLSHYHADHFDQEVEASLRRDLPIITTPHAKDHLASKGDETFTEVFDLDFFQSMMVNVGSDTSKTPRFKVTGMPGKHVPDGIIGAANDIAGLVKFFPPSKKKYDANIGQVPPTNGWMVELGYGPSTDSDEGFECGYRSEPLFCFSPGSC